MRHTRSDPDHHQYSSAIPDNSPSVPVLDSSARCPNAYSHSTTKYNVIQKNAHLFGSWDKTPM